MLANSNLLHSNIAPVVVVEPGAAVDRDLLRLREYFYRQVIVPGCDRCKLKRMAEWCGCEEMSGRFTKSNYPPN